MVGLPVDLLLFLRPNPIFLFRPFQETTQSVFISFVGPIMSFLAFLWHLDTFGSFGVACRKSYKIYRKYLPSGYVKIAIEHG